MNRYVAFVQVLEPPVKVTVVPDWAEPAGEAVRVAAVHGSEERNV
jgi:hypothetical protein